MSAGNLKRGIVKLVVACLLSAGMAAQTSSEPAAPRSKAKKPAATAKPDSAPESKTELPPVSPDVKPDAGKDASTEKEEHFDMTEVPPVVTHHQVNLAGKTLSYTATAGRLPIKRGDGKIEAEMFFVAYTLDGQEPGPRPLTFAFNGGPGSASVWLHMGALGPKRVVMQPNGFMPAPPFRMEDNSNSLLDRSDLVMVDAMGTGFSRAANAELTKKFLGVRGDIEGFGEFIRLYLTRYDRWTSPLFLLGESYGTTRAAGVSGYLADQGIAFNGITLLSMAVDFQTLEWNKSNDLPYVLLLPSYTMIAAYHKKLPADLLQDIDKTREAAMQWAATDYSLALAKGDTLTPEERQRTIDQLARYTGLSKQVIDQANLRIDVGQFTHSLLIDQKVRVGRLDGRFTGPDPEGLLDTFYYDPTSSAIVPPYTAVFNHYVRDELGYKTDMRYKVFAYDEPGFAKWEWGSAERGFPSTATALRGAMVKNPYMKILVMEGYYDLATPFFAANWTMDHLDLDAKYRANVSYSRYASGHMVYIDRDEHAKMKKDLVDFMQKAGAR